MSRITRPIICLALVGLSATCAPLARAETLLIPEITIRPNPDVALLQLLARGTIKLYVEHDITGARRLLEKVADAGSPIAARRLAESYDPVWQVTHGVLGASWLADPDQAFMWYKRAADLGDDKPGNRYIEAKIPSD